MIRSAAANRERNARGSAADRRARKIWMLSEAAPFGGNGATVPCVHCAAELVFETIEADRIVPGGSYRRGNVQPSCKPCNLSRSDNADWDGTVRPAAAALAVAV